MGTGLRALKIATVGMGVLILLGTSVLIVTIFKRASIPIPMVNIAAVLDEPAGTRIAGIAAVQDRLALLLQGGGVDRVVLVDPRTGAAVARISLRQ
jgi:hypothetical protein